MKIKKNGFGIIVSLMILLFLILYPSIRVGATGENGYETYNLHSHNYYYADYYSQWNWSDVDNSYMFFSSGNVVRVEALDDKLLIENYSSDYHLQSAKTITFELPIFGGFYNGKDAYYVMYGQENPNESDSTEVVRVVKYDKSWNRVGSVSFFGINTYIPFDGGSSDFAEYGNMLYIRTCHEMYKSSDGYHHQANMTFAINTNSMTEVSSYWIVMHSTCGYVSHSFNQYIRIDGNKIVAVDHGDAHPRSVLIGTYSQTNASEGQLDIYGGYTSKDMLTIPGNTGDNFTGVSVGGFEVSNSNYLVPVSRVYFDSYFSNNVVRNVSLLIQPKGSFNSTNTKEIFYTSYAEGSGKGCGNPYLVKINSNLFVLIWEELDTTNGSINRVGYTGTFKAVVIDENGNKLSDIASFDGELSDCEPIVNGNTVCWYTTGSMQNDSWYNNSDSKPKFYELKLNTSGNKYNFSINTFNGQSNTESVTYTVRHLQEKLDGNYESVDEEPYTVQSGTKVSPVVNIYEGFSSPNQQTVTVDTDGMVIEYRYARKTYNLTWNLNGGTASNNYTSGKVKYGSTIIIPNVSKTNYILTGWGASVPSTMPAKDLSFTAEWESCPTTVKYTVKHYQRTAEVHYEQEWELADTEILYGNAGESVTPKVKDYTGFEKPEEQTVTISANGNTLVEYKYYRESYKLTWNANGGSIVTGINYNSSAAYGGTFIAPSVKRYGYTFEGWEPELPETMPAQDMTFKAKWKSEYVDYSVEHYKQDLNGDYTIISDIDDFREKNGTSVTPEVRTYTGFKSPSAETVTLSSDENIVVKYYYERNSYSLTWDLDGGTASGNYTSGPVKYGKTIIAPTSVTKEGYSFVGWDKTSPSTMPAKDMVFKAEWKPEYVDYTVEHYKQDLNGKYTIDPDIQTLSGKFGTNVTPAVKTYTGFKSPSTETITLSSGENIVKYYYERSSYSLVWNLNGGTASGDFTRGDVKFEEKITAPVVSKPGYVFKNWNVTVPSTMPARAVTISANWEIGTETPYKVEHYKQDLDGNYSTAPLVEDCTGTTGMYAVPEEKEFDGYVFSYGDPVKIEADGSTVVKYYYERATYYLVWDFDGGSASGDYTEWEVKYGTPITVPTVTKENYTFDGWDIEVPSTMPANHLTITAKWTENTKASYKVEHYKQNLDGTYSIVSSDTQILTGSIYDSVTPEVNSYKGFKSPSAQKRIIMPDNSTIIQYKYDRKTFVLTWDYDGGRDFDGLNKITKELLFGEEIEEVYEPEKEHYTFEGWDVIIPSTMPAEDLTIKALWKADSDYANVPYRVEHYQEQLDGSMAIVSSDTQDLTAMAGSSVTPMVRSYIGFISPSLKTVTIEDDGSTVVKYEYKRKTYKLTWDFNGGSASGEYSGKDNFGNVKYGSPIIEPTVSKENYIFDGWGIDIPSTMPANDLSLKANWKDKTNNGTIASYVVEHYMQNLDGSYTKISADTQIKDGRAGSTVVPEVNSYLGFKSPAAEPTIILSDGTTVIKCYYERERYELKWDANEGSLMGGFSNGDILYGDKITAPNVYRENYIFDGWEIVVPDTMPACDLYIKARWVEESNELKCTVEHYVEKLDGEFTVFTETFYGQEGTSIIPSVKNYKGFSSPETQCITLYENGSNLVKYYYYRNEYSLLWNYNGGNVNGESESSKKVKYGETIEVKIPERQYYVFDGWNMEVPDTMPDKDLTIKALWKEDSAYLNIPYRVEHYKENLDGSYSLVSSDTQSESGKAGSSITPAVKSYTGFNSPSAVTTTINADGSTVVKYEYKRKIFNLTWDLDEGSASGKYTSGKVKYGAKINVPKISKEGYIFDKWSTEIPSTMPAKDLTIKASWTENPNVTINPEPTAEDQVKAFVRRFYTIILEREKVNEEEIEYYTSRLLSHEIDGCSVARGFVMSPEYTGKGEDNLTFVNKMYAAFFNREADDAAFYVNLLEAGHSREVVLAGFVNSPEFKNLCAEYGINSGELVVEPENNNPENNQGNQGNNPSDDVTKLNLDTSNVDPDKLDEYVKNLYLKILGRQYDEGGLQYWKEQIMAGTTYDAATAARVGFFESEEYKNKNKTSEQFVTDCYHAFLGREPEPDGLSYWMNKIDSGEYSKQKVIDLGFGHSEEFKNILRDCGFIIIE